MNDAEKETLWRITVIILFCLLGITNFHQNNSIEALLRFFSDTSDCNNKYIDYKSSDPVDLMAEENRT